MTMSSQANYFKIGVFVLAGFALLAGALIFLGAGSAFRPKIYLETYIDGTVQGIDIGSPVKFRGVQIGRISRIDFCFNEYGPSPDGGRSDYVYLEMEVNMRLFDKMFAEDLGPILAEAVKQGLRVMLQPQGITGLNFAELNYVPPKQQTPPLEIWWKPRHYYIPSAPGTLTSLLDSVNKIMDMVKALDVKDTMQEASVTMKNFNTTIQKFNSSLDQMQLDKVSADLQSLLNDLRAKADKIPVEELSADGKKMMESIAVASRDMQTLVDTVQTNPLLNADAMGNIVSDLQATAENFRVLSENLREHPSQLLFGQPPKRSPFDPGKTRR
jgi:ABC-type transporter Mla subunit MlaD